MNVSLLFRGICQSLCVYFSCFSVRISVRVSAVRNKCEWSFETAWDRIRNISNQKWVSILFCVDYIPQENILESRNNWFTKYQMPESALMSTISCNANNFGLIHFIAFSEVDRKLLTWFCRRQTLNTHTYTLTHALTHTHTHTHALARPSDLCFHISIYLFIQPPICVYSYIFLSGFA